MDDHRASRSRALVGLISLVIAGLAVGCSASHDDCGGQAGPTCTRVLFIGNSYTYVNDLPGTFEQLARAGGHLVATDALTDGGATLADAAASSATSDKLQAGPWTYVVLQEQSEIPSIPQFREQQMDPAARTLVQEVKAAQAQPLFFMTWAHLNGWPEDGLPDYASMQDQIDQGYISIARELGAPIAPVGAAWSAVHAADPTLTLWQDDDSHPTMAGTYLAACVFYAAIFQQSPQGLTFDAGLSSADAQTLQAWATRTVFIDPSQWGLP